MGVNERMEDGRKKLEDSDLKKEEKEKKDTTSHQTTHKHTHTRTV